MHLDLDEKILYGMLIQVHGLAVGENGVRVVGATNRVTHGLAASTVDRVQIETGGVFTQRHHARLHIVRIDDEPFGLTDLRTADVRKHGVEQFDQFELPAFLSRAGLNLVYFNRDEEHWTVLPHATDSA